MGHKHASRALVSKVHLARYKSILVMFCLLLGLIVWNSSTLTPVDSKLGGAPVGDNFPRQEDEPLGGYTILQLKESSNVQDGRIAGSPWKSEAEINAAARKDDEKDANYRGEGQVSTEASSGSSAGDEEQLVLDVKKDGEESRHAQSTAEQIWGSKSTTVEQNTVQELEEPISGNRSSKSNLSANWVFGRITSLSLPFSNTTRRTTGAGSTSCEGRYIYVYDLPPEFNVELVRRCDHDSLEFQGLNICDFLADSGMGEPANASDNESQVFVPASRWFNTHQYALELLSHARILKYECLTQDPNLATLFYIPYYGGLDVVRWHFDPTSTNEKRDALSLKLIRWLKTQPWWTRRGGLDHVLVLGKISWDFRRPVDGDQWGSRLLEFSETQKLTKVLIERDPWVPSDIGVPHPTYFHPQSASEIDTWLTHVRSHDRTTLVTFVGKDRSLDPSNVRGALIQQCRNATSESECRIVDCAGNLCQEQPAYVTRAFLTTHFCMQPVGDSCTRRSVFDSLIAGCIPVLFHPCTAYLQYPWHLPLNESSWSVYVSEDEVKAEQVNVIDVLKKISSDERDAMRATIINSVIPGLLYSAPGGDISPYRDAFDITIDQLLYRASHLRELDELIIIS